jgi:hypothetical protein
VFPNSSLFPYSLAPLPVSYAALFFPAHSFLPILSRDEVLKILKICIASVDKRAVLTERLVALNVGHRSSRLLKQFLLSPLPLNCFPPFLSHLLFGLNCNLRDFLCFLNRAFLISVKNQQIHQLFIQCINCVL